MPDSRRFLRPDAVARVRRLELRARAAVEGFMSGMHRSPYFGQSVEFLQHRAYAPGDDLRHIDWKVWARQDRFHIKQYEEETNLRCHLVVDASTSMEYGKGDAHKFDCAASIAAALAMLVVRQHDAVGLVTFAGRVHTTLPARSNRKQLDRILEALDTTQPERTTDFAAVLRETAEAIPRRGLVVIISDLLDGGGSLRSGLQLLRRKGHDVMVVQTLHDDELDFPFNGSTRFEGLEGVAALNCNPRALREGYLEALEKYLEQVRRGCAALTVDYSLVRTSTPLGGVLATLLNSRFGMPHRGH